MCTTADQTEHVGKTRSNNSNIDFIKWSHVHRLREYKQLISEYVENTSHDGASKSALSHTSLYTNNLLSF